MHPLFSQKILALAVGAGVAFSAPLAQAQSQAAHTDPATPRSKTSARPVAPLSSAQYIYQALLGEIAAQRNVASTAAATFLDLARKSKDARVARRATEIALQSQEYVLAAEAARLWLAAEPDSQVALQTLSAITAGSSHKLEDLELSLKMQLVQHSGTRSTLLMQLPQLISRYQDKQANRAAIFRLTEPYPTLPEAHYARAVAAALADDLALAGEEADAALKLRPDWEDGVMLRWRVTPSDKQAEQAERIKAFGEAHPHASTVRLAYISWLVSVQNYAQAQQAYQALLADEPDNDDVAYSVVGLAAQANDLATSERLLHGLIDHGYRDADLLNLQLGQALEELGRFNDALATLRNVSAGQHFPAASERQARILTKQGKLAAARELLHKAAVQQPEDKAALMLTEADLLRQSNDLEGAFAVANAALAASPDNPDALYVSSLIAEQLKKPDVLEQRLRRLIELKPDHAQAYNALGYSLVDRNVKLEEAASLLAQAIKLAPNDPAVLDSYGWLKFRQGDLPAALDYTRRAWATLPDPEVAAHLVEILWTQGKQDDARQIFRDVLKSAPNNSILQALKKRLAL